MHSKMNIEYSAMDKVPQDKRMRMRDWLIERIGNYQYPGLVWVNKKEGVFKIPWKHGALHGFSQNDALIFKDWGIHTGKIKESDMNKITTKNLKATFRCALHSLPDVEKVENVKQTKGDNACRVYKFKETKPTYKKRFIRQRGKGKPNRKPQRSTKSPLPYMADPYSPQFSYMPQATQQTGFNTQTPKVHQNMPNFSHKFLQNPPIHQRSSSQRQTIITTSYEYFTQSSISPVCSPPIHIQHENMGSDGGYSPTPSTSSVTYNSYYPSDSPWVSDSSPDGIESYSNYQGENYDIDSNDLLGRVFDIEDNDRLISEYGSTSSLVSSGSYDHTFHTMEPNKQDSVDDTSFPFTESMLPSASTLLPAISHSQSNMVDEGLAEFNSVLRSINLRQL